MVGLYFLGSGSDYHGDAAETNAVLLDLQPIVITEFPLLVDFELSLTNSNE